MGVAMAKKKDARGAKKGAVAGKIVAWPGAQDSRKLEKAQQKSLASLKTGAEGSAVHLASEGLASDVVLWVPTGSTMLDLLLRGGVPVGRIIEIYGREGVGKTTLVAHIIANVQRLGGVARLIDSEASFYMERAKRIGVNATGFGLEVLKVPHMEAGFELIYKLVPQFTEDFPGIPSVIVWDTIAAAPTKAEYEAILQGKAKYAAGMADKARELRRQMRVLSNWLVEYNVALVMINQVSEGMAKGGMPAADKSSGGLAIKFHSSARIEMKRGMEDPDYGQLVEARRKKNKLDGPETKDWKVKFYIGANGINDRLSMLRYLLDECPKQDFVEKSGAWIKFTIDGTEYKSYLKDIEQKVVAHVPDFDARLAAVVREQFLTGSAAVIEHEEESEDEEGED